MIVALSAGRDAPAPLRDRLALDEHGLREVLDAARARSISVVALSTCHRTELYATLAGPVRGAAHDLVALLTDRIHPADHADLRAMEGRDAVEHLMRVVSGLDSLVLGEPQVLRQVRHAYRSAVEARTVDGHLATIFDRALALGRRVRAQTSLGTPGRSLGAVAVTHLQRALGGIDGSAGTIVGAGDAARDAARALSQAGARLRVVSRRPASAAALAASVGGHGADLSALGESLAASDFAVVAIGGGLVVRDDHLAPDRAMHIIDLSVPRAVAVSMPSVRVTPLTALRPLIPPPPDLPVITSMIAEAVDELDRAGPGSSRARDVAALRRRAEVLARGEAGALLSRIDVSVQDADRIVAMSLRIANKLLHGPTVALRDGDEPTADAVRRVYGLAP